MTCGGCARAVTNAVKSVDDTASVHVDLAPGRVTISFGVDAPKVQLALEEAGYDVKRLVA